MTFFKINRATSIKDMISSFENSLNDMKAISNDPNVENLKKLNMKFNQTDRLTKKIENAFLKASDSEVIEHSGKFGESLFEYQQFKNSWKPVVESAITSNVEINKTETNNVDHTNDERFVMDQQTLDHESAELSYLNDELVHIVETSKEINQISKEIQNKLIEQRVKIVSIDKMIENSITQMEKGNKELDKADQHSKETVPCSIF